MAKYKKGNLELTIDKVIDLISSGWNIENHNFIPPMKDKYAGICDPEIKIIYIDKNQRLYESRKTIIHEIYHALLFENGYSNSEKKVRNLTINTMKKIYGDKNEK